MRNFKSQEVEEIVMDKKKEGQIRLSVLTLKSVVNPNFMKKNPLAKMRYFFVNDLWRMLSCVNKLLLIAPDWL